MNEQNSDFNWISQNIYTYTDRKTSIIMTLKLDGGIIINENNIPAYNPARISISLRDPRNNTGVKYQYTMHFSDLVLFKQNCETIFNSSPNKIEVFKNKKTFNLIKYLNAGNKKIINFQFILLEENKPHCSMSIKVSNNDYKTIILDSDSFLCLKTLVYQVLDNYAVISTNLLNVANSIKISEKLDKINCGITQNNNDLTAVFYKKMTVADVDEEEFDVETEILNDRDKYNEDDIIRGETTENGEIDDISDEPIEELVLDDTANKFNSMIENMEDTIIPEVNEFYKKIENKKTNRSGNDISNRVFLGSYLNNNLTKLTEWASAFLNSNENSHPDIFTPITSLFSLSGFPYKNRVLFNSEYKNNIEFRALVKEYIESGKFPRSNCYKLDLNVKECGIPVVFKLSTEILSIFIVYHYFVNVFLNKLQRTDSKYITNYNITLEFIRKVLFSIVLTVDFENMDDSEIKSYIESCMEFFREMAAKGKFDEFSELFSKISNGGKFELTEPVFEKMINDILFMLKTNKIKYSIAEEEEDFDDSEDVKNKFIEFMEEKNNNNRNKVKETQLRLFVETCEKFMSEKEYNAFLNKNVGSFKELTAYVKKQNNSDVFKLYRVIESNPNFVNRAQVLKEFRLFKEDESVTETRIISSSNNDSVDGGDDVDDIEKLLSQIDI